MAEIEKDREAKRKLVLSGGQVFYGTAFGASSDALCEIAVNTSMVGYQEIVSDPACLGQAVVMTYPLIGNYGMTDDGYESFRAWVGAMIVRDYNAVPSNFRYTKTLSEILEEGGVPGISGIDTREITRIVRERGVMPCLITDADTPHERCLELLASYTPPSGQVARVGCRRPFYARTANPRLTVAAVDCGIKGDVLRQLNGRGVNVAVVPHDATAEQVMALRPDGLLLSSGPGDPRDVPGLAGLVAALRGKLPIFGIGLGCQVIALAYGADIYKMKFGHRGGNHPVMDTQTGLVEITPQSHGFAIDRDSLAGTGLSQTHVNLLDQTVEGVEDALDSVCGVQFLPDGARGPQGQVSFYDRFVGRMLENKAEKEGGNHA